MMKRKWRSLFPRRIFVTTIVILFFSLVSTIAQQDWSYKRLSSVGEVLNKTVTCFCEDCFGYFWIGTQGGIFQYDPEENQSRSITKKPFLTDLYLFNERVPVIPGTLLDTSMLTRKQLVLNHSHYLFAIGFSSPVFRKATDLRFEYKLEGFNSDWVRNIENSRIATFTNIPAGNYNFMVRLLDNGETEHLQVASIRIKILPPFWKTWWAKGIYVIIISGAILGFVIWRNLRIRKEKIRFDALVNEQTKELKLMNQHKDRFFTIVSHDLKSPYISLVKYTDIIAKRFHKLSDKEQLESISRISRSQKRSYKYLSNLLDWSRIQIGRIEYNPENFNLVKLLNQKICSCLSQAGIKGIDINAKFAEEYAVYADYKTISVVINNLVTNAIKFSNSGDTISISIQIKDDMVYTSFTDEGVGMSPEQIQNLFRIDVSARTKGTDQEEGTGLGLILSKELIKENLGEIFVESRPGIGSVFTFSLPLAHE